MFTAIICKTNRLSVFRKQKSIALPGTAFLYTGLTTMFFQNLGFLPFFEKTFACIVVTPDLVLKFLCLIISESVAGVLEKL